MVQVYKGKQTRFPTPRFGSYEAMDLDRDVFTDPYSRFGAYRYDDKTVYNVSCFIRPTSVLWHETDWDNLQAICLKRNAGRYKPSHASLLMKQHPLPFDKGTLLPKG